MSISPKGHSLPQTGNLQREEKKQSAGGPATSGKELKEWTALLFLNGHNNLDEFGEMNLNQIEEVGSSEHRIDDAVLMRVEAGMSPERLDLGIWWFGLGHRWPR